MTEFISTIDFKPQRALISVSDKSHIVALAQVLHQKGVELIATGQTAALLKQEGLPVIEVSEYTGFPELMDGRIKTLHPAIHAGLLARGNQDKPCLDEHGFKVIDLVIVNLYPFEHVISKPTCDYHEAIEHIDIGGPTMVRAAAKNHAHRFVVVSPEEYPMLINCLQTQKAPADWGFQLAKKAFAHTAAYDAAITNYLTSLDKELAASHFPEVYGCQFTKKADLRYGENPHQPAIFYADKHCKAGSLGYANLIQGKQLSYNNLLDADAALDCVKSFPIEKPICVIVKHTNPCGVAIAATQVDAYLKAFQCDPTSAYGGIIAFNHALEVKTVKAILEKQFVEVIIAPAMDNNALPLLAKKENIRVLITGNWQPNESSLHIKKIAGGLLAQVHDSVSMTQNELRTVTTKQASKEQIRDVLFAWSVAKHVKSNAIVYAKDNATLGIGGGQTSRVMSARIGLWQAEQYGFSMQGAVMASDAFIPFKDTVELAAHAGIKAIIQPGGSIRDPEIIACANELGLVMLFTGVRHFKH